MSDIKQHNISELIGNALIHLSVSINTINLYPPNHPIIDQTIYKSWQLFEKLLDTINEVELTILGDNLIFENKPLYELKLSLSNLITELHQRGIGSITFSRGLTQNEIRKFVDLMNTYPRLIIQRGGADQELRTNGVQHIRVAKITRRLRPEELEKVEEEIGLDIDREIEKEIYYDAVDKVKEIMEGARTGQTVSLDGAKSIIRRMVDSIMHNRYALFGLTAIKSYDEYTFSHSVNVCILTLSFAHYLNLDEEQINEIGIAALMHDIGKTFIPQQILNKPGKLNEEEWEIMQKHPLYGVRALEKISGMTKIATIVAFEHHLHYDLSGYPDRGEHKKQNIGSMMVGIADSYDAITTVRPYKKALLPNQALRHIQDMSGKFFNPQLVGTFIDMIGIYPMGSFVRLDTNELAIVFKINPRDKTHPIVKIIFDRDGDKLEKPILINLAQRDKNNTGYERSIVQSVDPVIKGIKVADYL